jgi:MYXO-CTERM domain-containing protein
MKVFALVSSLAVLLVGGTARANPVAVEVLRLRQAPHTLHVQVTYAVDSSFGKKDPVTPISVSRDGSPLSVTWSAPAQFTANTGSGLAATKGTQFCDCGVSVGSHTYKVRVKSAMGGNELDMEGTVTLVQNLGDPVDAGVPHGDVLPWDIPEPSQLQGLDCQQVCSAPAADGGPVKKDSAGPVKDSAGPAKDSTGPAQDSSATIKPKEDSGGCSVAGHGPASALLLLLGLGLLWGVLRRPA